MNVGGAGRVACQGSQARSVGVRIAAGMTIAMMAAGLTGGRANAQPAEVVRIGGSDRVATAIKVYEQNRALFTSDAAVLARSDDFADALTAGPLAAAMKAPVLNTSRAALDSRVLAALTKERVRRVVIVGGPAAVTPVVEEQLKAAGFTVERIAGDSRYDTANAVARKVLATAGGTKPRAYVATGRNFPDALSAGAAAGARGGVVLLSQGRTLDKATSALLGSGTFAGVTAVGGDAVAATKTLGARVVAAAGATRYETATKLAELEFRTAKTDVLTSGETFADALAGGPLAALTGAPLLLTTSSTLNTHTNNWIAKTDPTKIIILGGEAAIAGSVASSVAAASDAAPVASTDAPTVAPTDAPTVAPTETDAVPVLDIRSGDTDTSAAPADASAAPADGRTDDADATDLPTCTVEDVEFFDGWWNDASTVDSYYRIPSNTAVVYKRGDAVEPPGSYTVALDAGAITITATSANGDCVLPDDTKWEHTFVKRHQRDLPDGPIPYDRHGKDDVIGLPANLILAGAQFTVNGVLVTPNGMGEVPLDGSKGVTWAERVTVVATPAEGTTFTDGSVEQTWVLHFSDQP